MDAYLKLDINKIPLRNKWTADQDWLSDKERRSKAKENQEIFYEPVKSCRNGHNKRYTTTNHCVECCKRAKSDHRKRDPQHTKKLKTKHHLNHNYGISEQDYQNILINQNFVCAICEQPENILHHKNGKPRKLAVDHNHKTNKIRGLLCINCNQGLGKFQDSPDLLRKAADYCE